MARRKAAAREPAGPLWSIAVPVAAIPETGRKLDAAADAATRAALAKAAGVVAVPKLELAAELVRHGDDGVRAVGQVTADVEQACVVSLEPVQSAIVEPFDLLFVPAPTADDTRAAAGLGEGSDDPPEVLRDGVVELGAIAVELLLLGIDPYPRKPGAAFNAPPAGDPAAHPFAALAALKKPT